MRVRARAKLQALKMFCFISRRVFPAETSTSDASSKKTRSKSAKVVLGRQYSRRDSTTEHLEPWSTKNLTNMNDILDS